jgi:hypothetical protein
MLGWLNNDLGRMWKEAVTAWLWYYISICLGRLNKVNHLQHTSWSLGQDLNQGSPRCYKNATHSNVTFSVMVSLSRCADLLQILLETQKTRKYCENDVCCQCSSCETIHFSAHILLALQFLPHWTQTTLRYRLKNIFVIWEGLHHWFSHLVQHVLHRPRVEV